MGGTVLLPPGEIPTKESHGIELKTSLAELREGAQTVVAFANAHGGDLFFGVAPDGKVVGVDIGANTLEDLAAKLDGYIYPYVPAAIYEVPTPSGKTVIQVSVAADQPPVVGVYLYSSHTIHLNAEVPTKSLVAYLRVGRANRKVRDFMWLRGRLPSDPVVLIDGRDEPVKTDGPTPMGCSVWLVEGTGPAYGIQVGTDPVISQIVNAARDLPASSGERRVGVSLGLNLEKTPDSVFHVLATYRDDWGCVWETLRRMMISDGPPARVKPTSEVQRRIIMLPPKGSLLL